jgi:S1-C subfamily serine protease
MNNKVLIIFLFVFCFLLGCTTYNSAIKKYDGYPPAKAMASAYDNENRWFVGYGYRSSSVEQAIKLALDGCEKGRLNRGIQSPCKVSLAHDTHSDPVSVNERGEYIVTSFQTAVDQYQSKPKGRVLYFAYDSPSKWVCAYAGAVPTYEKAHEAAQSKCESMRERKNISSPCKAFAVDDQFYYNKDIPTEPLIVKYPVKEPGPSIAPVPTAPAPGPGSVPEREPVAKPNQEEKVSYGTGFAVRGDGYILTSYHIISGADLIAVSYQSEKLATATLIKHSSTNDLALLKIKGKTPQYLELEEPGNVNIGDRVFTIGFPVMKILGTEPKYSEGTISSLAGVHDEASFMQISVPIQPGNSGGSTDK